MSLQFTPVEGRPGIWLAPSRHVLNIVLAEDTRDSRQYHRIVEANQTLFKNGPPTPIMIPTGRTKLVPKMPYGNRSVDVLEPSLEVVRASYKPPEYIRTYHPQDPRLDPRYRFLYADDPKVMREVERYNQLYADEKFAHEKVVHEDHVYEEQVAGLHRGGFSSQA